MPHRVVVRRFAASRRPAFAVGLCVALFLARAAHLRADDSSGTLARAFPSGAVGFAELHGLEELLERPRESDYLKQLLSSPQVQQMAETPQYRMAMAGRQILETQLGMDLRTAVGKVLGGRVAGGLYLHEGRRQPDVLVVLHVEDAQAWEQLRERIEPLLVLAEGQGRQFDRSEVVDGTRLARFQEKAFAAVHEQHLVLSNARELLTRSLELLKAAGASCLASDTSYRAMTEQMGESHLLRVFANTKMLADATGGRALPKKVDNPLASLLLGGMIELAATTPYAGMTLDIDDSAFVARLGIAGDTRQLGESHQVFFSTPDSAGTPPIPAVPELQGGFTLRRDFANWYRHREELLEEKALPGFDKFESGLANLLPGKDFGEDILPLIGPNLTFISAVQTYPHLDGRPAVQLPAFAIVIDLAQPKQAADVFRLFFQTLSAILNLQAGQEGREPMIMDSETYKGVQVTYGRFLKKPEGDQLPFLFNFVPAAAHVGDTYVISSSQELCKQLIDVLQQPAETTGHINRNLNLELHPSAIADSIEANRHVFEARSVQGGKTLEQAQGEVSLLLELLRHVELLQFSTSVLPEHFQLQLEGSWK